MNNTIIEYINGMEVVKYSQGRQTLMSGFARMFRIIGIILWLGTRAAWPWMAIYSSSFPAL